MKIGLVAMSGIRVCDAELLRLGLTLPGFVERSKAIAALPSLGLLTLAGMTPPRHEIVYVEVPGLRQANGFGAGLDLVAISSYTAQIGEAYALSDRLRAAGVRTVMGGPHVSCLPDEAAAHCDAVVMGHGELSWPEVLADAETGRLRPRYGATDAAFDLKGAPIPAFELLDIGRYNRLTIQTSRGCPHRCEFCAGSVLFCRKYAQKPAKQVLCEIDRILRIWRRPFIEFADDNTFVDRNYWRDLLPGLARRRVRWFTETDISVGEDDALLEGMRMAGCVEVLIGLESPVPAGLDGVETRSNWKLRQWPRYRELLTNIQRHGIRVNGCFVLGLDGHGPDIFDRVREFAREADLFDVQITIPTPFPGTALLSRLRAEGRLLQDPAWETCTLFDLNFQPRGMAIEQLTREFRALAVDLYSAEETYRRRKRFEGRLRARRQARVGVV